MVNSFKQSVWHLLRQLRISYLIGIVKRNSYFRTRGWINSIIHNKALNQKGLPVPWLTYPFMEFITPRLNKSYDIFEFGGGNSTLFWTSLVKSVDSIDHDKKWVDLISKKLPENGKIVYVEVEDMHYTTLAFLPIGVVNNYNQAIKNTGKQYDIIIVDGVDRNNCIINSLDFLKDAGIIVIDNMEYENRMQESIAVLTTNNFKRIDFWGLTPLVTAGCCTTIFYRTNNCLNL
jgi:hypothetical protein